MCSVPKERIIIDTDIGDDIDDALAVAFALNSEEIDVAGITTVYKNTAARAELAKKLLMLYGRESIPVYAGCPQPLINRINPDEIPCQFSNDMKNIAINSDKDAVDFIIGSVLDSSGDITLVPIGPLTNIAVAICKRTEIKDKIKRIILMGGAYYFHYNEWNIACDPEAARIVFESGIPIKVVGLDVTLDCKLTKEDMNRIYSHRTGAPAFLSELVVRWQQKGNYFPILHDPLAVYAVFDREILAFKNESIAIETKGEFTRGTTFNRTDTRRGNNRDPVSGISVACSVDSRRFIDLFIERVF